MATEANYEPTLHDVMDMLIGMDTRITTGFTVLNERIDLMDSRVVSMERTIRKLVLNVADMEDENVSLDRSREMHTAMLKDHGRRIRKLEKI